MTIEEIRELIQLVKETAVAELEVQRGENRVRIRQSGASEHSVVFPAATPVTAAPAAPAAVPPAKAEALPSAETPDSALVYVKAPMVGTFYESPSPDAAAFVRVGEQVSPGQFLCIIESMKLMNEIPSDIAGIVEKRLVQNGQPVEYGEPLFGIRPV
jgi:acetyl-CoA carboxylase biotin carboxyl carrier protein